MANDFHAVSKPARDIPLRYSHCWWGEIIYGTKQELQALGIAPGLPFPGEPDGTKRELNVIDPRGLPCEVIRCGAQEFCARIRYPDRPCISNVLPSGHPGVTVEHLVWSDLYCGRTEALIAAGWVRADQLPGAPGMGKTVAYFGPDGAAEKNGNHMHAGSMTVRRAGKFRLRVYIHVSDEEEERRHALGRIEQEAFESRMWALPRPRPLVFPDRDLAARKRREQMRLVWSRPVTIPTLTLPPFKF